MVMKYLMMSGWVTVTGPPRAICSLNRGTTEPLEPSTLPKRTATNSVCGMPGAPPAHPSVCALPEMLRAVPEPDPALSACIPSFEHIGSQESVPQLPALRTLSPCTLIGASSPALPSLIFLAYVCMIISHRRLEAPMILVGFTALSVDMSTKRLHPCVMAA